MDKKRKTMYLSKVSLFNGMKERSLQELAGRLIEREFKAGERIIEQGKEGFGLFIIASGEADVKFVAEDGSEKVVNHLIEGDFFGEMALLDDEPRSASVYALEDNTMCLFLNRIDFIACMMNDAEMGVSVARELTSRLRRALSSH